MRKKMNLQMFAEAVSGKKIIYQYRVKKDAATTDGTVLAFVTENSLSISADADSTITKDGAIRTPNEPEIEINSTSIFAKGDTMIDTLKNAMLNNELMQIWRADLESPITGQDDKFKGTYYEGYLTSFEETSNAEDYVEYSLTFGVNGKGADGNVTVSVEQQDMAAYVFQDTPKTGL